MVLRKNRKRYLLYPEDKFKLRWDGIVNLCLTFTCLSIPLFISFHEEKDHMTAWQWLNLLIDIIFGLDIFIVFFTAFYDDDFQIVDNLKDIARNYILGWFLFDLLAIMPFDMLGPGNQDGTSNNMNQLVRIAKLGRMQKLIKLARLIRLLKVLK